MDRPKFPILQGPPGRWARPRYHSHCKCSIVFMSVSEDPWKTNHTTQHGMCFGFFIIVQRKSHHSLWSFEKNNCHGAVQWKLGWHWYHIVFLCWTKFEIYNWIGKLPGQSSWRKAWWFSWGVPRWLLHWSGCWSCPRWVWSGGTNTR